jgi:hypothetical protein
MKYAAYFLLVTFIVLLAAFAVVRTSQLVLRRRAEALFADIRTLELRKSSFEDAQTVIQHWKGMAEFDGPCNQARCFVSIQLTGGGWRFLETVLPNKIAMRSYTLLGGRPGRATAAIKVLNNVIWSKSYSISLFTPPYGEHFGGNSYALIGDARTVSSFLPVLSPPLQHPNYLVGRPGGCEGCLEAYAMFTPYADPSDISRLMQFNFACITNWHPCHEPSELMPNAWTEYARESAESPSPPEKTTCSQDRVEMLGRDSENVAVADLVSSHPQEFSGEQAEVLTLRLANRLKRSEFWDVGTTREVVAFEGIVAFPDADLSSVLVPGRRFVLMFSKNGRSGEKPGIRLDRCGLDLFTEQNLAMIQRRVREDFMAFVPPTK